MSSMPPVLRQFSSALAVFLAAVATVAVPRAASAEDGYDLWLRYAPIESAPLKDAYRQAIAGVVVQLTPATTAIATKEVQRALKGLIGVDVPAWPAVSGDGALIIGTAASPIVSALGWGDVLKGLGPEGYVIRATRVAGKRAIVVASTGDSGGLYGTFHLLRLLSTATPIQRLDVREKPRHQVRILNHWDNLNGTIERGYAGRSLWKWEELPGTVDPRLHDYARANVSVGLNGTVINSVNANPRSLTADYIADAAAIADVFRPYGLKVYLSANFAAPRTIGGLPTADPLDPAVQQWWKDKATEIYKAIPDFGGFTVKANSEGQPGPQDYKRTHADGANLLADAVKPHGGIVMWRAFVYDASVDPDRTKRAYKEFVPLDGVFRDNVFVQTKNGPLDFMPREPFHPQFGAMPKTPNMAELQITQEYLGWSNHLVYLAPMWKEFFDADTFVKGPGSTVAKVVDGTLQGHARTGIAGVANTGSDRNWTGHHFAAANWYAYGRLAWNPAITSSAIADEWIRATWSRKPETVKAIAALMLGSRETFVNYTMPLGLHHLIGGDHYAVMPENNDPRRLDWTATYYHKADDKGIGFDRTRAGSGAVDQYAKPIADKWNDVRTTPENLLLWFHHLPWDHTLASGQTLWQGIVGHYHKGAAQAAQMERDWAALKGAVDDERHAAVAAKLAIQTKDAATWRDKCLNYFAQFSKQPTTPPATPSADASAAPRTIAIPAAEGQTIRADVYGTGERTVVLAHGGRFNRSSWKPQAATLVEAGFRVVAIDFRASCQYDAACLAQDVLAAVRYLRESAAKTVAVVGASLGGGAAAQAAIDGPPDAINRIVLLAHMTVDAPERIRVPTLFILARDDASGSGPRLPDIRAQYEKAQGPKEIVLLDGNAHAQFIFATPQGDRLTREIVRFVSQY